MPLEIKENEILANHSTFKIGGSAKYFCVVKSKEELIEAIEFAREKGLPFFVFGGGSNILFRDEGYGGAAVKSKISNLKYKNCVIEAGAGVLFGQLIIRSIDSELSGLEWGVGIPGTVGGAVAGNAGAYGHSISEFVKSVTVLDENLKIKKYSNEECGFSYRESRFKDSDNTEIILEVEFALEKGDRRQSGETISDILTKRRGKLPPYPSAGSVFKNIILDELENGEEFLKLIPREKIKGGKFPVGYLIEDCGLVNKQVGDALISDKHANFIVNVGHATSDNVLELIKLCKTKVKEKFNIALEEEIVVLPNSAQVIQ